MIISAVPYEVVDVVWEDAKRFLEPAVKTAKRRYTIDVVKKFIDGQQVALWVAMDEKGNMMASVTTRIYDYPEGRALEVDWIGGEDMEKWLTPFVKELEAYARSMGCDFMTGQGRRGWIKPMKKLGWEEEYVSFRRDLSDG